MPKPRYAQISNGETPYVHVVSRTVRRSFLCGKDKYSGKNFNHRRQWLEDEMLRLASDLNKTPTLRSSMGGTIILLFEL